MRTLVDSKWKYDILLLRKQKFRANRTLTCTSMKITVVVVKEKDETSHG